MSKKCLIRHDWEVIRSGTAESICFDYLHKYLDKKQEFIKVNDVETEIKYGGESIVSWNFINCPGYIEFEDKVCLDCEEVRLDYTRITKRLDHEYQLYMHQKSNGIHNSLREGAKKRDEIKAARQKKAKEILSRAKI